jgi:hypothetical protein
MILSICDEDRPDGWMAQLSRYRNLVVHRAPITSISEKRFLTVKHIGVGTYELKKVYLGIPKDPVNGTTKDYVDALPRLRDLLVKLLQFAEVVAKASPIRPSIPHIDMRELR